MGRILPFTAKRKHGTPPAGTPRRRLVLPPLILLHRDIDAPFADAWRLLRMSGGWNTGLARDGGIRPVRKGQIRMLNNGRDSGGFRAPCVLVLTEPGDASGCADAGHVLVAMAYLPAAPVPVMHADVEPLGRKHADFLIQAGDACGIVESWNVFEYDAALLERSPVVCGMLSGLSDALLDRITDPEPAESGPESGLQIAFREAELAVRDAFLRGE